MTTSILMDEGKEIAKASTTADLTVDQFQPLMKHLDDAYTKGTGDLDVEFIGNWMQDHGVTDLVLENETLRLDFSQF